MSFKMILDPGDSLYKIVSYTDDAITINDQTYFNSIIVSPDSMIKSWAVNNVEDINELLLTPILTMKPEIVIIGTGIKIDFPTAKQLQCLIDHNVGYEIMNTGAACRSYAILMSEGRHVVAGLIIPNS